MRYNVSFIYDHMVVISTVEADNEDGAIKVAHSLVRDEYGINLDELKWSAIDIVAL